MYDKSLSVFVKRFNNPELRRQPIPEVVNGPGSYQKWVYVQIENKLWDGIEILEREGFGLESILNMFGSGLRHERYHWSMLPYEFPGCVAAGRLVFTDGESERILVEYQIKDYDWNELR